MRGQLVALVLVVGVTLPMTSWAEDSPFRPSEGARSHTAAHQLVGLLQMLGFNPISKAHAAECTEEGENCTSTEQRCAGLECTGGPPATCIPED
jgi:hypothetical protein